MRGAGPNPGTGRSALRVVCVVAVIGPMLACGLGGCGGKTGNPIVDLMEPMFPPTPGEVARDAFNVYDPDKRRNSVALLSAAKFGGEEPYVRMYRLLSDDPDATVRAASVKALGLHGSVEDAKLIIPRLGDEAAIVRWEAAKALQKIHDPEAASPLVRAMQQDEDADVRQAAARALGQYPSPAVFSALVSALDDANFGVANAAHDALETLTGYDFGYDGSFWLIWARQNEGELFEHQEAYHWQPYQKPPGLMEKVKFWKKTDPIPPRAPRGVDATGEGERFSG